MKSITEMRNRFGNLCENPARLCEMGGMLVDWAERARTVMEDVLVVHRFDMSTDLAKRTFALLEEIKK